METKKCEKSENTLMRKTKKELVEIILRKDDVEIRLKEELKSKTEESEATKKVIDGLEIALREKDDILDKQCKSTFTLGKKLHKTRVTLYWVIAVAVIAVALAIVL